MNSRSSNPKTRDPASRGPAMGNPHRNREQDFVTTQTFPHGPGELFHLQIGVTYACQCRCDHCGVSDQRNRGQLLSPGEIVDLCAQARKEMGARVVELIGGEPLVRKEIVEIVRGCAAHLDVVMSSNGIGFTRETARQMKDAGLKRCFFSLDSHRREKHDANRGFPGCFDAVMQALDYCEAFGIETAFSTCAMAELVMGRELEALVAFTRQSKAAKLRLVLPKMAGKWKGDASVLLGPEQIDAIRRITEKDPIAYVEAEGNYSGRIEKCLCLRGHAYINPFGVMQPCVYTFMHFGSVRELPLSQLYARMHRHPVFADKSILNLCLLQNPEFIKNHLSGISPARPLARVDFTADESPSQQTP